MAAHYLYNACMCKVGRDGKWMTFGERWEDEGSLVGVKINCQSGQLWFSNRGVFISDSPYTLPQFRSFYFCICMSGQIVQLVSFQETIDYDKVKHKTKTETKHTHTHTQINKQQKRVSVFVIFFLELFLGTFWHFVFG